MWNRLISSLLSAALATALVLGFLAVAEPVQQPPHGPLQGMTGLDAESERAVFQLALALTTLAIDSALERSSSSSAGVKPAAESDREPPAQRQGQAAARMLFYSFAARSARRAEAGT